jgi:predicted transcriptional regulator
MGDFSYFEREQIVGERLAGASVPQTGTLLGVSGAAVSKVLCTRIMGRYQRRGTVGEDQH